MGLGKRLLFLPTLHLDRQSVRFAPRLCNPITASRMTLLRPRRRLLRDSLGGKTKTCIIATIAPTVQVCCSRTMVKQGRVALEGEGTSGTGQRRCRRLSLQGVTAAAAAHRGCPCHGRAHGVQCQEETTSTLDYAHRAKNIKNKPEVGAQAHSLVT